MSAADNAGRRRFLALSLSATGALLVGFRLARADPAPADLPAQLLGDDLVQLGPFVRIERDNRIVIGAPDCEIGQGAITALPMLVAEELDVAWHQVRVVQLPYGYAEAGNGPENPYGDQRGNETAPADTWRYLREAGATARWLLLAAAANEWKLPVAQLRTAAGEVVAPDGRKLSYGALARSAAATALPDTPVALKTSDQLQIVGKPTRVADAGDVVRGRSRFGIDHFTADPLVAVIARCPHLDGALDTLDDSAARKVAGVRDVIAIPGPKPGTPFTGVLAAGVAVVAENTWAVLQGREQLKVTWREGPWARESSAALAAAANALLDGNEPGIAVRSDGDFAKARKRARRVIEARYELPFLAHATMEPAGALIDIRAQGARLIAAVEDPDGASRTIADMTGLAREAIEILLPRGGSSFGRRLRNDYVAEAVLVAKALGKPVKLMWTRDDDLGHDFYRPFGVHALAATFDRRKRLTGWSHRCAATPINYRNPGLQDQPAYAGCMAPDGFPAGLIANLDTTFFTLASGMPRDPSGNSLHGFHAFAVECFLDEIAVATRQDAVKLRLDLLAAERPLPPAGKDDAAFEPERLAHVLTRCAEKIGWGVHRSDGHGLGIACHHAAGGYLAHAFEVAMEGDDLRIHRAVCVADIGRIVNPLGVEANLTCGTLSAASSALRLAITTKGGQVQQKNFPDYPPMRMAQAPRAVDVEVVASDAEPRAVLQTDLPSAAPALANAIYAATTVRVRKLPLMPGLMLRL